MAWHDIIALEFHARSDDIKRGMSSPPLDNTHSRQRRHRRYWTTRMVGLRRAWHDITAFGQHTRSNDVRRGMPSSPLGSTHGGMTSAWHYIIAQGRQKRSNDVRRDMPSPPLDSTHGQTSSGVACHHRLWAAHTVERRLTWHAIIAFGQHKRSNDVRRGMTSQP